MDIRFKFFLILISIVIVITIPALLFGWFLTQYVCPDGSIYISDSGLPENLQNKGCQSIKEHEISLKESGLAINQETKLLEQGIQAYNSGKFQDAIDRLEKALSSFQGLRNIEGITYCVHYIGLSYLELGDSIKAISYFESNLRIYLEIKHQEGLAVTLINLGKSYTSMVRYEDALAHYEEALKIYKQLKIKRGIASAIGDIANTQFSLAHYGEAITYYKEMLKLYEELNDKQGMALSFIGIGIAYGKMLEIDMAITYQEKALEIYKKLNFMQGIAVTLNYMGYIFKEIGEADKALTQYEQVSKIYRQLDNKQKTAESLNSIGETYFELGQYDKTLAYYEEALKIYQQLNTPKNIAQNLNLIGNIYKDLGQYDKAISCYREALLIYEKLNFDAGIAISLNNIGGAYNDKGLYDEALSYYEKALIIDKKLNNKWGLALSLNNIGSLYQDLGQDDKALSYYEEALNIEKEHSDLLNIAIILNNIGSIYLKAKKYKTAEDFFSLANFEPGLVDVCIATKRYADAINLLNKIKPSWNASNTYRIQFHTQNGFALKGSGNLRAASAEFLKSGLLIEETRKQVKSERTGFLSGGVGGGRIRSYKGLIATLSERAISGDKADELFKPYGDDLASAAFYFSEATKARALLETLAATGKKSNNARIPENLRTREERLLSQLARIDTEWDSVYKQGEKNLKRLQEKKRTYTDELNVLIKQLREQYPRYAAINYPEPVTPKGIPLRDNEVLLEYALTDDAGYLFVIRKGQVKKLIKIPVPHESLESEIMEFMMPMNNIEYDKFSIKTGGHLYQLLLSEALTEVSPDEKLIIVPDGILGLLPFEALVINEENTIEKSIYVGDRYNISYYPSATVLATQRTLKSNSPAKVLFALGNPVYSSEDPRYLAWKEHKAEPQITKDNKYSFRGLAIKPKWGKTNKSDTGKEIEFPPLPETGIEIKEISKIIGGNKLPPDVTWLENQENKMLLSIMANETELKRGGLEKYKYIHFATHASLPGMIQGINEPFILLSQVENNHSDDGFLTLSEVSDMNLSADLVVLSACVTGVGKEIEGEGVANFARAFQLAGAKSVVVSLWEVASNPAVEFMTKFYGYLKSGKNKGEALNLSRREIKTKYPNPFYWAVFILHGETDSVFYKSTDQGQPPEDIKHAPTEGNSLRTERIDMTYLTDKSHGNYSNLVVKDSYAGLMWTRNANLGDKDMWLGTALDFVDQLNRNAFAGYKDWRLPTVDELTILATYGNIKASGFTNVQRNYISATGASIDINDRRVSYFGPNFEHGYVWPVRSDKD